MLMLTGWLYQEDQWPEIPEEILQEQMRSQLHQIRNDCRKEGEIHRTKLVATKLFCAFPHSFSEVAQSSQLSR